MNTKFKNLYRYKTSGNDKEKGEYLELTMREIAREELSPEEQNRIRVLEPVVLGNLWMHTSPVIKSVTGLEEESDVVVLSFEDGATITMQHHQDCCEMVYLEDFEVSGVSDDMSGATLHSWHVDSSSIRPSKDAKSEDCDEWTFYNVRTSKGSLWMRWFGTSNGYYSTDVDTTFNIPKELKEKLVWGATN